MTSADAALGCVTTAGGNSGGGRLACTNIIENMMGTVRRICRNAKRWRDASMALR
jgi:hypothetical protein